MTVPNEQDDEFREQLLDKATRPSLSQVGAAKIRVRLAQVSSHHPERSHEDAQYL